MTKEECIMESRQRQLVDDEKFERHIQKAGVRDVEAREQMFVCQTRESVQRRVKSAGNKQSYNNMDYKTKYSEALAKARELKNNNPSDEGIQNWVKDTFPELAEDEVIKEQLVILLNDCYNNKDYFDRLGIPFERVMAWLERQNTEVQQMIGGE